MGLYAYVGHMVTGGDAQDYESLQDYQAVLQEQRDRDDFVREVVSHLAPDQARWEANGKADPEIGQHVGTFMMLHFLRRYACYLSLHGAPPPPAEDETEHPAVDETIDRMDKFYGEWDPLTEPGPPQAPPCRFPHLVWHSDCNGYYVPAAFPHPVFVKRDGVRYSIGSSVGLLEELNAINQHLGVESDLGHLSQAERDEAAETLFEDTPLDDSYKYEKWGWSILHWLARESVARNQVVIYA